MDRKGTVHKGSTKKRLFFLGIFPFKKGGLGEFRYYKTLCEVLVATVFGHEIHFFIPKSTEEEGAGCDFSFVDQSGQDFLSEMVSDRKFYPTGFFQKTSSDRIFYPTRFQIDNSIRRVFWQTLSDRISYPKLFWIENCVRQIFPPRKLINHYKQTVYQSVTKISNRKFVFFLQIICIFPPFPP